MSHPPHQIMDLFDYWYDRAKLFAQSQSSYSLTFYEYFALETVKVLMQLYGKYTEYTIDQCCEAFYNLTEIILTKPKFAYIKPLIRGGFGFEFYEFVKQYSPNAIVRLLETGMPFGAMSGGVVEDPGIVDLLVHLVAGGKSGLSARRKSREILSYIIEKTFTLKKFSEVLNSDDNLVPSDELKYIIEKLIAESNYSNELDLYETLFIDMYLCCYSDDHYRRLLIYYASDEKFRVMSYALAHVITHVTTEAGTTKLLSFMNMLIRSPEMEADVSRLVEYSCVQFPSIYIVRFIFYFKVTTTTFHFLTSLYKPLHLKIVHEAMLIPLTDFVNALPSSVKANDTLNECCGFLINLFYTHFIDTNDKIIYRSYYPISAEQFLYASISFTSIILYLFRRGYGDNERFAPMIQKLMKANKFGYYLTVLLSYDRPEDTLTERKAIYSIIVDCITNYYYEQLGDYFNQLMDYSAGSNICFGAIVELVHADEPKTLQLLSLSTSAYRLFATKPKNDVYYEYYYYFLYYIPTIIQRFYQSDSFLVVHEALKFLVDNYIYNAQFVDSTAERLFLCLFYLDYYLVKAPVLEVIYRIIPISNLCAPYLALYLPEMFIGHPNIRARSAACMFFMYKYGYADNYGINPIFLYQMAYFYQYLPFSSVLVIRCLEFDEIFTIFRSDSTKNTSPDYYFNHCRALLLTYLATLNKAFKELCYQVMRKHEKNYGREAAQQGPFEVYQIKDTITNAPTRNCVIDLNKNFDDLKRWIIESWTVICGTGCYSGGWAGVYWVFYLSGVDWKSM